MKKIYIQYPTYGYRKGQADRRNYVVYRTKCEILHPLEKTVDIQRNSFSGAFALRCYFLDTMFSYVSFNKFKKIIIAANGSIHLKPVISSFLEDK